MSIQIGSFPLCLVEVGAPFQDMNPEPLLLNS